MYEVFRRSIILDFLDKNGSGRAWARRYGRNDGIELTVMAASTDESKRERSVFFVSDSTGITAETLGETLLTQFPGIRFRRKYLSFVNGKARAKDAARQIRQAAERDGVEPLVFSTLADEAVQAIIVEAAPHGCDLFRAFMPPLEAALQAHSVHKVGRMHGMRDTASYLSRMDVLNYALNHDDGVNPDGYREAAAVLLGVSRSGKTPTCVYLAMHFHLKAANYPLTEEDLEKETLPERLRKYQDRLLGLTIDPKVLSRIRSQRRPGSRYASIEQCRTDCRRARDLFTAENVPSLDTSAISVEEIATTVIQRLNLPRHYW